METDDRGPDLLWTDRIAAILGGVTAVLPFALVAGLGVAGICAQSAVSGLPKGGDWVVAPVMPIGGTALAATALSACRGVWRGRRGGFTAVAILSLVGLPLLFLFPPTPLTSDVPVAPPTAFVLLALGIAAYARLRLTTVGLTPI